MHSTALSPGIVPTESSICRYADQSPGILLKEDRMQTMEFGITALPMKARTPEISTRDSRVSMLVVSWVLMIPLLYYAAVGGFWFQRAGNNNPLSQRYSTLVDSPQSGNTISTALAVFGLILIPVASRSKAVFAGLAKDRLFLVSVALAFFLLSLVTIPRGFSALDAVPGCRDASGVLYLSAFQPSTIDTPATDAGLDLPGS